MGNGFFTFKQFTVNQGGAAMKVCTDACLFGSLLPEGDFKHALDIGTGTGLLSLMFAQKNPGCCIDAIEIDDGAAAQAAANFASSQWSHSLEAIYGDILTYKAGKQYDIIFSNPPFYEHDLRSGKEKKDQAHHGASLTLSQLLPAAAGLLSEDGIFCVLLPYARTVHFIEQAAGAGLFPAKKMYVRQTEAHNFFRSILFFSKALSSVQEAEIIIIRTGGTYSERFTQLLSPFYLYL